MFLKEMFAEVRDLITTDFSAPAAPVVIAALARLSGSRATKSIPTWFNIVISNVPGPARPMYFGGAAARTIFRCRSPITIARSTSPYKAIATRSTSA